MRRQQELERIKEEVGQAREGRADIQDTVDELKAEVARLGNAAEGRVQQNSQQMEAMQKDIAAMGARIQALEQKVVAQELAAKQAPPPPPPPPEKPKASTFEEAKKLFDDCHYDEAVDVFKTLAKAKGHSEEKSKSQFFLAESYFGNKDFASAAIAYNDFKKANPKNPLVPNAIYGQMKAFLNLGDNTNAKLFYKELADRYPKSKLVALARRDMRKAK